MLKFARLACYSLLVKSVFTFKSIAHNNSKGLKNSGLRMYTRTGDSAGTKHILIPIATGTEEIEAVVVADVLVRAGAKVCIASVELSLDVVCSRGVKLHADAFIGDTASYEWDLIVIPGGMPGATNLRDNNVVSDMLIRQNQSNKEIAAICAAPAVVLASLGILAGKKATCYPAPKFLSVLPKEEDLNVVVDHNVITSKGPGTAMEFAIKLIEILYGKEKSVAVAKELLFHA